MTEAIDFTSLLLLGSYLLSTLSDKCLWTMDSFGDFSRKFLFSYFVGPNSTMGFPSANYICKAKDPSKINLLFGLWSLIDSMVIIRFSSASTGKLCPRTIVIVRKLVRLDLICFCTAMCGWCSLFGIGLCQGYPVGVAELLLTRFQGFKLEEKC